MNWSLLNPSVGPAYLTETPFFRRSPGFFPASSHPNPSASFGMSGGAEDCTSPVAGHSRRTSQVVSGLLAALVSVLVQRGWQAQRGGKRSGWPCETSDDSGPRPSRRGTRDAGHPRCGSRAPLRTAPLLLLPPSRRAPTNQQPTTNHQPTTTNQPPPATNHHPPIVRSCVW